MHSATIAKAMLWRALSSALVCSLISSCARTPEIGANGVPTYAPRRWWQPSEYRTSETSVQHRALVDYQQPGYDYDKYRADNADCNALASTRPVGDNVAQGAVGGLVLGAVLGGIVGNAGGDTGHGAAYGAALGTVSGAAQGAAEGVSRQTNIVRECMIGRGYRVLD